MKELTIQELKQSALDTLTFIDGVCTKHNIKYYLAYGTLIGAIRHNGFIPWDDDIDIFMFRNDFNYFRQVLKEKPNTRFKIQYAPDDEYYTLTFPKVVDTDTVLIPHDERYYKDLGVYVDIFPLDAVPEEKETRTKYQKRLTQLKKLHTLLQYKFWIKGASITNNLMRCLLWPSIFIKPNWLARYMDKFAYQYEGSNTSLCGNMLHGAYGYTRETFKKDFFKNGIKWSFEGRYFVIPTEYDKLLTHIYGDYMKLPPKEKQVTHHNFIAYKK